jgi:ribosomal protein S12 methylthiotransferase
MPDVALRTTFITGFPGETRAHFDYLLRFMQEVRFDHVGIFPYYPEDGTPAATLPGQVSNNVKQRRKRRALELQQGISQERNGEFVGRQLQVLVEGAADRTVATAALAGGSGDQLLGRTHRDAPEVDGFVLFRGRAARGDLVTVEVTAAGPYDLFGHQVGAGLEHAPHPAAASVPASPTRIGLKALPVLQPR